MVAGGLNECALALGVEKMRPGSLGGGKPTGEPTGLDLHYYKMNTKFPMTKAYVTSIAIATAHVRGASPPMAQFFGNAAREYMALCTCPRGWPRS